mmetsp:Transcript_56627/g.93601  ORF Transcript_56627/g.93601 Transcript_56627/m.93601 type:complete len:107 (-) Transcript_56627:18-338(-)
MCVKCHPELAGVGIENSWGKSAMHFRRHNDCSAKNLHANVLASLNSNKNMPLKAIRKFARKTREYLRVYMGHAADATTHSAVERLRRRFKCHRGSIDFDFKFIRDA